MSKYELPYFGEIEMDSVKDYYCLDAKVGIKNIKIDINFTMEKTCNDTMEFIKGFLLRVEKIDQNNIEKYRKDFKDIGETYEYIQFYFEELFEEELSELINT